MKHTPGKDMHPDKGDDTFKDRESEKNAAAVKSWKKNGKKNGGGK